MALNRVGKDEIEIPKMSRKAARAAAGIVRTLAVDDALEMLKAASSGNPLGPVASILKVLSQITQAHSAMDHQIFRDLWARLEAGEPPIQAVENILASDTEEKEAAMQNTAGVVADGLLKGIPTASEAKPKGTK